MNQHGSESQQVKIKPPLSSKAFHFYTVEILAPIFLLFSISFFSRLRFCTSVFLRRCLHQVPCISVVVPRSFLSFVPHKNHCSIPPPSTITCSFWMDTLMHWQWETKMQCGFCHVDNLWVVNCPTEGSELMIPIPLSQRKSICPAVLQNVTDRTVRDVELIFVVCSKRMAEWQPCFAVVSGL